MNKHAVFAALPLADGALLGACPGLILRDAGGYERANVDENDRTLTKAHSLFGIMSQNMPKRSAGLLMYRRNNGLEVFLIHPGGPFWVNKDLAAWSIPKGEYAGEEEPLAAARREFQEETGFPANGDFIELGDVKQAGGKIVSAWAFEGDCDASELRSNTFTMEWPPRSGRQMDFPEVDRGAWYSIAEARKYLKPAQCVFLDRLFEKCG